ncbi:MAG: DUF2087 domain-containing protein [Litoreibacter sp.]
MNMIARAAGFQNVQHLRSTSTAVKRLDRQPEGIIVDARAVERTLHQFDEFGQLLRWPSKRNVQTLALWALWATLPANQGLDERDVNDRLAGEHQFEDPATLRRTMISCGLLTRRKDCTNYRRVERKPSAEALAIIQVLNGRRKKRSTATKDAQHV